MTVTSASTYIIGKPRTGKSTLLETLILRDIDAGLGVCVIDPHSDLVRGVMAHMPPSRADDVVLLDLLAPDVAFGINPFACENANDPIAVERTVTRVMQIFERLWGFGTQNSSWGPRLEQHLRSVTLVLLEHGLTMTEAPLLLSLTESSIRQHLVKTLGNPQIRAFWEEFEGLTKREKEMRIESTSNKLAAFVDTPLGRHIVGQEEDTINWRSAMDAGKIVLVKLDAQLADLSGLIGSVIVGRILEAGLSRENDPVRRPFHLYCDEFQRFATDDFARLLTETGKWGIQTTVAHQYRGQLDERNRGATLQAGNLVVFSVSGEDAKELAGNFKATPPDPLVPVERPVRVPCGDPVSRLLSSGHRNPEVRALAEGVLRQMHNDLESLRSAQRHADPPGTSMVIRVHIPDLSKGERWAISVPTTSVVDAPTLEHALVDINDLLAKAMQDLLSERQFSQLLSRIIYRLRTYLKLYFPDVPNHKDTLSPSDVSDVLEADYAGEPRSPQAIYAYRDRYRSWLDEKCLAEPYFIITNWFSDVDGSWGASLNDPEEKARLIDALKAKFFTAITQPSLQFWDYVWRLADALKADPILVDSGQYETVLEPSRTYSDVSDQIANELVTLPRFCAKTRYQGVEETIAVAPVALPKTHVPIAPAGRNRRDVVAALEQRHRQLRDDSSPPPPSAPRTPKPQTPPPTRPHLADGLPPRLPAAFHPVDD